VLTDPENLEEWSEEVWATTFEEAQRKCQQIAGRELTEVFNVTQKTKNPAKNGSYKFICWFRTEKVDDGSDNSNNPGH
jgi:hypothetical protein